MKLLRELISEIVNISPEYMKKEKVREAIQGVITGMVTRGEIKNEQELENFFSSADMSLKALKMVPFETYQKLSGKPDPNRVSDRQNISNFYSKR
jgi:hypothetical protein